MNRKERRKNKNINTSANVNNDFQIAFNYHNSGDLGKAEVLYKKILNQNSNHFDTLRHLGILYKTLPQSIKQC
jgi:Tfp pilus assembly protein PilF